MDDPLIELDDVLRDARTILQFHLKLFLCILRPTYTVAASKFLFKEVIKKLNEKFFNKKENLNISSYRPKKNNYNFLLQVFKF